MKPPMHESSQDAAGPTTVDLPLRGLASAEAADIVTPPLRALSGVLDVAVLAAEFRVRVTFDPAQIDVHRIRETLHGIVPPDTAHGDDARDGQASV